MGLWKWGQWRPQNCFLREQHLKKKVQKKKSEHVGSISNTSEMDRDHFFQSTLKDNFVLVSMSKRLWCTRTDYNSKLQSGWTFVYSLSAQAGH